MLSDNIKDYYVVSQGKTTIPGLDDSEELLLTDVSWMVVTRQSIFMATWNFHEPARFNVKFLTSFQNWSWSFFQFLFD